MSADLVNLFSGRIARALHDAFELGPVSRTVRRFFFDSTKGTDEVKVSALAAPAGSSRRRGCSSCRSSLSSQGRSSRGQGTSGMRSMPSFRALRLATTNPIAC